MNLNYTSEVNEEGNDDVNEERKMPRKKTPMQRFRKPKAVTAEDLDENGIVDRDEDLYDDNDDVSTSTLRGSEESLDAYINEENKINELNNTNGFVVPNERFQKVKRFMNDMKDKGKGLSCKNADTVIDDEHPNNEAYTNRDNHHKKSCAIM